MQNNVHLFQNFCKLKGNNTCVLDRERINFPAPLLTATAYHDDKCEAHLKLIWKRRNSLAEFVF
jgi:hypothetical protein